MRLVEPGKSFNLLAGLIGRRTNCPWQLGQVWASRFSAQCAQNVHSKEQIKASVDAGGRSLLQYSQLGRSSNMSMPLRLWVIYIEIVLPELRIMPSAFSLALLMHQFW